MLLVTTALIYMIIVNNNTNLARVNNKISHAGDVDAKSATVKPRLPV